MVQRLDGPLLNLTAEIRSKEPDRFHREPNRWVCSGFGIVFRVDTDSIWIRANHSEGPGPETGQMVEIFLSDGAVPKGSFISRVTDQFQESPDNMVIGVDYPTRVYSNEMRQQHRFDAKIIARFHHVATDGVLQPFKERRQSHGAVIRDLHEQGAQIVTDAALPHNARLTITFSFRGLRFEEAADVVWSEAAGTRYLYGLRFTQLNLVIQDLLRSRPGPS